MFLLFVVFLFICWFLSVSNHAMLLKKIHVTVHGATSSSSNPALIFGLPEGIPIGDMYLHYNHGVTALYVTAGSSLSHPT